MKRTKTLKALSILSLALFLILPSINAEPPQRNIPHPDPEAFILPEHYVIPKILWAPRKPEPIPRQKPRPNFSASSKNSKPCIIPRNHWTPMAPKRLNQYRIINNIPDRLRRNLAAELAECARSENNTANDGNSAQ